MPVRSFFGDDIFISYARRDSSTYASGLADELTKRGFSCFIDRLGTEANPVLPGSLRRKLRGCTLLIVIGTRWSGTRDSIRDEIREFNGTKRPIIPVDVDGSIYDAIWYKEIEGIAPEPEKNPQALDDGNPSPAVVSRIEKAFRYRRRDERLRLWTLLTAAILIGLISVSAYAGRKAANEIARAQEASREAERQRQIAERERQVADEQRRLAEEAKVQAASALKNADAQKAIADAKTEEAARQSELASESLREARRQQQEAARQRAAAARQMKVTRGLSLADEAERAFESDPMLGLRLGFEALSQVPEDDAASRGAIENSIRAMSAQGRVRKLGAGGFDPPHFINNSRLFVLVRVEGPSELRRADTGDLIQVLPDKVTEVVQRSELTPVSYFLVKYEQAPGEVRRADTGEVVSTGKVKGFEERGSPIPFAVIHFEDAPDQLVPTDRPGPPVTISGELQSVSGNYGWMLFFYNKAPVKGGNNLVELRRLDLKLAASYAIRSIWGSQRQSIEVSSDRSLFCVKYPTENFGYEWAELRRMDSGELIPLSGKVRDISFSRTSPHFLVAYTDAPGEIRRTDSDQIIRLPKVVRQGLFGRHSAAFAVEYADRSGEFYLKPGAQPTPLHHSIVVIEAGWDLPYLRISYGFTASTPDDYFDEKTGARLDLSVHRGTVEGGTARSKFVAFPIYPGNKKLYELRLKDTGARVPLPRPAVEIRFLEEAPYLLIVYEGGLCELRRIDDGTAIPLPFTTTSATVEGRYTRVRFSPNLATFVIFDSDGGALFRAPSGERIIKLSGNESDGPFSVVFSPDSSRFIVSYERRATELRRSDTGALIQQLSHFTFPGDDPKVGFNKLSTCFTSIDENGSLELRRADTGELLAPATGGSPLISVNFSDGGAYAVLVYEDNRAELWRTDAAPRRAAELEPNLAGLRFDDANQQLIVWHSDKRAYILDLAWLSDMTAGGGRMDFHHLLRSSCEAYKRHPVPAGVLERHSVGEALRACQ